MKNKGNGVDKARSYIKYGGGGEENMSRGGGEAGKEGKKNINIKGKNHASNFSKINLKKKKKL